MAIFMLFVISADITIAGKTSKEKYLKAAYINNLLRFTQWPDGYLNGDVNLCITGANPFGRAMQAIVERNKANGDIKLIENIRPGAVGQCDVIYISMFEQNDVPQLLIEAKAKKCLTISDEPNFIASGGMVEFSEIRGKLSYIVNVKKLSEAGLSVNPLLLENAGKVIR